MPILPFFLFIVHDHLIPLLCAIFCAHRQRHRFGPRREEPAGRVSLP